MDAIHQQAHQVFSQYVQEEKEQCTFVPTDENALDHVLVASHVDLQDHIKKFGKCKNTAGESFRYASGYIDEGPPNAFSDQFAGHHIVGMDVMLANIIYRLSLKCFADQEFFSDIGDAEIEGRSQLRANVDCKLWLYRCLNLASYCPAVLSPDSPRDFTRRNAASYLTLLMLRFIWFHELNHGLLGHTNYLQTIRERRKLVDALINIKGSSFYMHEFDTMAVDAITLQYMELEADNVAFRQCFKVLNGNDEFNELLDVPQATRCRLAIFAQFAITWLIDLINKCLNRCLMNTTHPKPSLRLAAFYSLAVHEVRDLYLDASSFVTAAYSQFSNIFGSAQMVGHQLPISQISNYQAAALHLHSALEPFRYRMERT